MEEILSDRPPFHPCFEQKQRVLFSIDDPFVDGDRRIDRVLDGAVGMHDVLVRQFDGVHGRFLSVRCSFNDLLQQIDRFRDVRPLELFVCFEFL